MALLNQEAFNVKKHTRLIALLMALALVLAACGDGDGADGGDGEEGGLICEVTDVGGVDDKGFNASAWAGAQRAAADFGAEPKVLESQAETDYEVNINSFVDQECDIIVTVGFLLGDATREGANANPDQNFTIVDFAYGEDEIENNNVKGLVFNTAPWTGY